MYILEEEIYFWLLLIIPVLALFYIALYFWKKKKQKQFAIPATFRLLTPDRSWFKPALKFGIMLLALTALAIALVNPKIGNKMETVSRKGVDIVFAVDVSKSMEAVVVARSCLEKLLQLVMLFLYSFGSDRFGIIAYSGSAFPQLSITTVNAGARMFLQSMIIDMV